MSTVASQAERTIICGILALGFICVVLAVNAAACSCIPETDILLAKEQADTVFAGRIVGLRLVTRLSEDPTVSFAMEDLEVTVAVHSQWKGDISSCTILYTAFTCCVCGFNFQLGEEYLIYAYADDDGVLRTSICSRTQLLESASEDLVALGQLRPMSLTAPEAEGENE